MSCGVLILLFKNSIKKILNSPTIIPSTPAINIFIFLFGATGFVGTCALSITSTPFASAILIASSVNTVGISFAIFAALSLSVSLTDTFIICVSVTVETDILLDKLPYDSFKCKFFITSSKTFLDFIISPYVTANCCVVFI